MTPDDDCYFLMYFIMGTYFGPDVKCERMKKSALQRISERSPPYTSEQLAGSNIKISEIEQVYYYLLRKAEKSHVVKVPILHQFIQGSLPSQGQDDCCTYPQFPALFPPELHPQIESLNKSIANIVYIRNPPTFYIKEEDIKKFKKLTRLDDVLVQNNGERRPRGISSKKATDDKDTWEVPIVKYYRWSQKRRRLNELLRSNTQEGCNGAMKSNELAIRQFEQHLNSVEGDKSNGLAMPGDGPKPNNSASRSPKKHSEPGSRDALGIVILTTEPTREELDSIVDIAKNAYALTGTAAKGHVGSAIGLMDIGESEDSYLFRVALPGVKRENRSFQCMVESDGRVLIKGETVTGEKTVERYSQTFVMQSQNMCPPGPFSISFQLPGPVDPQQFSGVFGDNAILEGKVMKRKPSRSIQSDTLALMPPPSTLPEDSSK